MKQLTGKFNTAKVFATTIEESCEQQILDLCNEEWCKNSKIRIQPDCHSGKSCVIGTTMTITDKIVPGLVGVDIGCGLLTTKFRALNLDLADVDRIIKDNIPMGMNIHDKPLADFSDELDKLWCAKDYVDYRKVSRSLGTTGSGNHFLEIDKDEDDCFYLVVHTGSRNFGKKIAEYYQDKAVEYHKNLSGMSSKDEIKKLVAELKASGRSSEIEAVLTARSGTVKNEELSYLEGALFNAYLNDMQIAQRFAVLNRKMIADIICNKLGVSTQDQFETIHNYIDIPNSILRKGAVSAQAGEKCLIPINMRDGSLICIGKGNPDYNFSAPHGAGRLMSRSQAKKTLSMEAFKETMKGIYSTTVIPSTLDEAPDAYKPMAEIIENIKDTVDIVKRIKPIYNIKATE